MIAETLYRNEFSLYYEKRLFLVDAYGNPRTVYPDFTIPIGIDNEYVDYLVSGFLEQIRKNLVYV